MSAYSVHYRTKAFLIHFQLLTCAIRIYSFPHVFLFLPVIKLSAPVSSPIEKLIEACHSGRGGLWNNSNYQRIFNMCRCLDTFAVLNLQENSAKDRTRGKANAQQMLCNVFSFTRLLFSIVLIGPQISAGRPFYSRMSKSRARRLADVLRMYFSGKRSIWSDGRPS